MEGHGEYNKMAPKNQETQTAKRVEESRPHVPRYGAVPKPVPRQYYLNKEQELRQDAGKVNTMPMVKNEPVPVAKANAGGKARANAAVKAKAKADAKARANAETRAKGNANAKTKVNAVAKSKYNAEAETKNVAVANGPTGGIEINKGQKEPTKIMYRYTIEEMKSYNPYRLFD